MHSLGLSSLHIRSCLLENQDLSLDDAFKQARALEHAQKHSTNYDTTSRTAPGVSVAALKESDPNDVSLAAIKTMIDSGSELSFMSDKVANRLKLYVIPIKKQVTLADPSHSTEVVGEVVTDIMINNKTYIGQVIYVLKKLFVDVILGKDFMKKHKSVTFNFQGTELPLTLEQRSTCAMTAMEVDPPPLFSNLTPDVKPIVCKTRKYSKDDLKFIANEKDKLLKEGVIEPSTSPWRAQPLVVPETDSHRKRLTIDYSRTINKFTELDAYPFPNVDEMVREISSYKYYSTYDLKSAYHQIKICKEDRKYTAFEANGKLFQFTRTPKELLMEFRHFRVKSI